MQLEKTLGDPLGGRGLTYTPMNHHTRTLFFFHGLGDNAYGSWEFIKELEITRTHAFDGLKIILPTAAMTPISMYMGTPTSAWADLHGLDGDAPEDYRGWNKSMERIHRLIDNEVKKHRIPARNIYLTGFSMGAALAYCATLRYPEALGGCIALSGFLPLREELLDTSSFDSRKVPFLHLHGNCDDVVGLNWGKKSVHALTENGYTVTLKVYEGLNHSASPKEIRDMKDTLISWFKCPPEIEAKAFPRYITDTTSSANRPVKVNYDDQENPADDEDTAAVESKTML